MPKQKRGFFTCSLSVINKIWQTKRIVNEVMILNINVFIISNDKLINLFTSTKIQKKKILDNEHRLLT